MSYSCNIHGWQHSLSRCPACSSAYVSTSSVSEIYQDINGRLYDEIKVLRAKVARYEKALKDIRSEGFKGSTKSLQERLVDICRKADEALEE